MSSYFDYTDPYMNLPKVGDVDCRDMNNFDIVKNIYFDKLSILNEAHDAAHIDHMSDHETKNPHSKIFSPLKFMAWSMSYCFWRKCLYGNLTE